MTRDPGCLTVKLFCGEKATIAPCVQTLEGWKFRLFEAYGHRNQSELREDGLGRVTESFGMKFQQALDELKQFRDA